jgi:hypothetical protein
VATELSIRARVRGKLPRLAKFGRRRIAAVLLNERISPRAVFVLGAQRSGTRLPLLVLERAPEIITYSEGSTPFFNGVLLRDDRTVSRELNRLPFPFVVLKPICESHRAPELLDTFSHSKVVWIYRQFRDAVNSAVAKWVTGRRNLRRVATRDVAEAAWRLGGLREEKLELAARLYSDAMSLHAAEAVMWYLRTSLFFDLRLTDRSDVFLVKYDNLVLAPEIEFPRLFDFLGCRFESSYLSQVYPSSVRRQPFPAIPGEIENLCESLMERLDRHRADTMVARPDVEPSPGGHGHRPCEAASL